MGALQSSCKALIENGFVKPALYKGLCYGASQNSCKAPIESYFVTEASRSPCNVSVYLGQQYAARGICSSFLEVNSSSFWITLHGQLSVLIPKNSSRCTPSLICPVIMSKNLTWQSFPDVWLIYATKCQR